MIGLPDAAKFIQIKDLQPVLFQLPDSAVAGFLPDALHSGFGWIDCFSHIIIAAAQVQQQTTRKSDWIQLLPVHQMSSI